METIELTEEEKALFIQFEKMIYNNLKEKLIKQVKSSKYGCCEFFGQYSTSQIMNKSCHSPDCIVYLILASLTKE